MNKLDSFSNNFCNQVKIKVGDEYKVFDLEHDEFYKQLPDPYRKQVLRELGDRDKFNKQTWHLIYQITDYFTGEYTETTDEDFQEIWKDFFYHWYWSDIYLCHSEEILEEEKKSWKDRLDINPDKCHGDCPYRLFKLVKRIDQNKGIYASVWTGLHYEIDREIVPLVWASANDGMNWIWWRELIEEFIGGEQLFIKTQKLAGKRILREIKDNNSAENENKDLDCNAVVFDINASEAVLKNRYLPFDACNPEIPKGLWDNLLNWFMTKAGWLGYMQNMNDKKERLTTGENFKDLHAVSNIQYRNLKQLNQFARKFGKVYPNIQLNFNVSNWGEAAGLPQGEFAGEEIDNVKNNDFEGDKEE